jgi:hypothetical protein
MSGLDLSSPITGGAQTGFTSPTFTVLPDTSPAPNGKQDYVSAIGGTVAGSRVHSVSSPFTTARFRPVQLRGLPQANPITGVIKNIPNNVYKAITRVGLIPAAGQPAIPCPITTSIPVPAGAEVYDVGQLKAAISLHIGALNQLSAALGATVQSGAI